MRIATDMSECQKASLRAKHATKTEKDEEGEREAGITRAQIHISFQSRSFLHANVKFNLGGMQKLRFGCMQPEKGLCVIGGGGGGGGWMRGEGVALWANVIS